MIKLVFCLRRLPTLLDDERTFIDLPNSPLFFTEERRVV